MEINGAIIFMVGSLYMERCYLGHKVIESYGMMEGVCPFFLRIKDICHQILSLLSKKVDGRCLNLMDLTIFFVVQY